MNPSPTLYERLRQRGDRRLLFRVEQPPLLEDWLRYWNDSDTDLVDLRNFGHWLNRARPLREQRQP